MSQPAALAELILERLAPFPRSHFLSASDLNAATTPPPKSSRFHRVVNAVFTYELNRLNIEKRCLAPNLGECGLRTAYPAWIWCLAPFSGRFAAASTCSIRACRALTCS